MKIPTTTCSSCDSILSTEFCEFCDPDIMWETDEADDLLMICPPTLPSPTDEELDEMSAYYDELDFEARVDAHDDMDHDYRYYNV
jgi:hypothetical protein